MYFAENDRANTETQDKAYAEQTGLSVSRFEGRERGEEKIYFCVSDRKRTSTSVARYQYTFATYGHRLPAEFISKIYIFGAVRSSCRPLSSKVSNFVTPSSRERLIYNTHPRWTRGGPVLGENNENAFSRGGADYLSRVPIVNSRRDEISART